MELIKFVTKTIDECTQKNLKKNDTHKCLNDFLNSYGIEYKWDKHLLLIDYFGFEISFNTKGICRGYAVCRYQS